MKITEHFSLKEFRSEDGTPYPSKWIDERLYPLCLDLEKIRAKAGKPLVVTSGFRIPKDNQKVKGKKKSQHLVGRAVDIKYIRGVRISDIVENLIKNKEIKDGGVGIYKGHLHYDHGPSRRWLG